MSLLPKACLIAAQLFVVAPVGAAVAASNQTAPSLPVAYNPAPTSKIKYDDLDYLMKKTVLRTGRSEHKSARKTEFVTGSRVSFDNPKPSRLEGNRVLFHQNRKDIIEVSQEIRDAMLAVPGKINFAKISKNEQLAYWLNLHNIIVYHEVAKRYPMTNLEPFFANCETPDSLYCERSYHMAGQMVSLKDIRDHVVENWDNPLVIYGFYMGAVGTPNVRNEAFSGGDVWQDLRHNAIDFIHSVRGTRDWTSRTMRVSEYYLNFPKYFPNFEADILSHVRDYAEGEYLHRLRKIKRVKANIDDWHIADLYNGHLNDPVGAGNLQRLDPRSVRADNPVPMHAQRLMAEVVERNKRRRGVVGVEEVVQKSGKKTEQASTSKNKDESPSS